MQALKSLAVLSTTLDKVAWKTTRIVRDVDEIRTLKSQARENIYVVGGATLVSWTKQFGSGKVSVTFRMHA